MSTPSPARTIKGIPFLWAAKDASRIVTEHFAESNKVPSARSVYFALCELASNEQAERFQAKVATIARFAGVSTRTVHDVLPELELIKVVAIERQTIPGSKMDAPSVYTLLAVCDGCAPLGNDCIPLCNGPEQTSVAENLKNLEKNLTEESQKETISAPAASSLKVPHGVVDSIYQQYPRKKQPSTAHRAIRKALAIVSKRGTSDPVAWLTNRVQAYAKSRAGEDQQFTPYPATWFNAGSYDEDFSASSNRPSSINGHASPAPIKPLPSSRDLYPQRA